MLPKAPPPWIPPSSIIIPGEVEGKTHRTPYPKQLYRAKHVMAFFVIGDASGSGKGVAVVEQYGVEYEAGPWKMQWRKESSNVREAKNLTDRIERLGHDTALNDHEVPITRLLKGRITKGICPAPS